MQEIIPNGRNNTYKIFTSRVEVGNIPNAISYVELFMTAMKVKNNFCNLYQYEMRKSWDGRVNNAYKIFTSRMEEGSTISYVELFMTTMKNMNFITIVGFLVNI